MDSDDMEMEYSDDDLDDAMDYYGNVIMSSESFSVQGFSISLLKVS